MSEEAFTLSDLWAIFADKKMYVVSKSYLSE